MAGPNLPENIDSTYDDSTADASFKTHQQHHDAVHDIVNKFDKDDVPTDGDAWIYDATSGLYKPSALAAQDVSVVDAGGYLQSDHVEGALQELASTWPILAYKTADETVSSSTTLQDDDDLFFDVGANELWFGMFMLRVSAANETMDIKFAFTVPFGSSISGGMQSYFAATAVKFVNLETEFTSHQLPSGSAPNEAGINWRFWLETSSTPGTVQFQWAQNVSDAGDLTVMKGSYLQALRMA